MNIIRKSEDDQYKEWLAKNEKFLARYVKENPDMFTKVKINDTLDLFGYFNDLSHSEWLQLNKAHIYVELQNLLKSMVPYYIEQYKGKK